MSEEYVLRDQIRSEIGRLARQHEIWREPTAAAINRAGFTNGNDLLDLGCGPGAMTFDLAEIAGPKGSVLAVDTLAGFVAHVRSESERLATHHVHAVCADARALDLAENSLDGAICRWVLMFVPGVDEILRRVFRALRPGGTVAIMDYTNFGSMSLYPGGQHFRRVYDAVHTLIARAGGDADIGGRMPSLLAEAGFEIIDMLPTWRLGRPGEELWEWLEATFANHGNLVEAKLLTSADLDAFHQEWNEHAKDRSAYFTAPPLLTTIGRKAQSRQ